MKHFIQNITLMGEVISMDVMDQSFELMCRSQDRFKVRVRAGTEFNVLKNLDNLDRDRLPNPDNTGDSNEVWWKMKKLPDRLGDRGFGENDCCGITSKEGKITIEKGMGW